MIAIEELYTCFLECGEITTDTRNCPSGSLFVALKGERFNGNAFAAQALANGCRYALIDEPEYATDKRILLTKNCLETLQQLANHHRKQLGTTVIGITGTNGKTTTKELVATVLSQKFNTLYTQGNQNNHIGVPLTLLKLTKAHQLAVIEMGANHPGEINTLVHIAEPDLGLITNVGKAHLGGFGSFEGVIRTKGELYDYLRSGDSKVIFIDKDNAHLQGIAAGLQQIGYTSEGNNEAMIKGELGPCAPFLTFCWEYKGKAHQVNTHLIGSYNLKNALAAITVGCHFGIEPALITQALESYVPQNNRSQLTETASNHLVVDAYNANPTSMMAALDNFKHMEVMHKCVVLGDMKELGEASLDEHQKIADYLKDCNFEKVILVGEEFGRVQTDFTRYQTTDDVKQAILNNPPTGCYILIKGSNSMKLAQLKELL